MLQWEGPFLQIFNITTICMKINPSKTSQRCLNSEREVSRCALSSLLGCTGPRPLAGLPAMLYQTGFTVTSTWNAPLALWRCSVTSKTEERCQALPCCFLRREADRKKITHVQFRNPPVLQPGTKSKCLEKQWAHRNSLRLSFPFTKSIFHDFFSSSLHHSSAGLYKK